MDDVRGELRCKPHVIYDMNSISGKCDKASLIHGVSVRMVSVRGGGRKVYMQQFTPL